MQYFYAYLFWFYVLYRGLLQFLATNEVFPTVDVNDLNVKSLNPDR